MKDKRLAAMMNPKSMPFDGKRMIFGGFKNVHQPLVRRSKGNLVAIAKQKITPCLWFDTQAEEAAKFYARHLQELQDRHASVDFPMPARRSTVKPAGSVMVVEFRDRGPDFHGVERRAAIQLRRSGVVPSDVRDAGRDRLLLDQAHC